MVHCNVPQDHPLQVNALQAGQAWCCPFEVLAIASGYVTAVMSQPPDSHNMYALNWTYIGTQKDASTQHINILEHA